MKTVALWGCGKIGRATAALLAENGFELAWLYDSQVEKAALLSKTLGCGRFFYQKPNEHPPVDLIIDATGSGELVSRWHVLLKERIVRHVILTRREPKADVSVIFGVNHEKLRERTGTVIASGSCTGNTVIPFLHPVLSRFPAISVSCNVLHPLKQPADPSLHRIPTALPLSVADHLPGLAGSFEALAMEIPVQRGMAIDISITFRETPVGLEDLLEQMHNESPIFRILPAPVSSETIIGQPWSCALERPWILQEQLFRGLLWQDNEHGFSCRVLDICKYLREHCHG